MPGAEGMPGADWSKGDDAAAAAAATPSLAAGRPRRAVPAGCRAPAGRHAARSAVRAGRARRGLRIRHSRPGRAGRTATAGRAGRPHCAGRGGCPGGRGQQAPYRVWRPPVRQPRSRCVSAPQGAAGRQVGLRRAPRSGLGTGDGTGRLPRDLLLGTRGVEHVLVDEDGPGVELVALIRVWRAGGRRLGCVVVRHEVPLSRVQHHAIPDRRMKTRRHPDRPEANARSRPDSRGSFSHWGAAGAAATDAPGTTRPRHATAHRGSSVRRRWGDSNSRGASTPTSLAGRRTRPLCDISIAFPRLHRRTHGQPTGRMPVRANLRAAHWSVSPLGAASSRRQRT